MNFLSAHKTSNGCKTRFLKVFSSINLNCIIFLSNTIILFNVILFYPILYNFISFYHLLYLHLIISYFILPHYMSLHLIFSLPISFYLTPCLIITHSISFFLSLLYICFQYWYFLSRFLFYSLVYRCLKKYANYLHCTLE